MPLFEQTIDEAERVQRIVETWLTERLDDHPAGMKSLTPTLEPPDLPEVPTIVPATSAGTWRFTEWNTDVPGKQRGRFVKTETPGVRKATGYQPNADLLFKLDLIPRNTRLGVIVHRFLERGYELMHPGFLGVEVKYEHHKHADEQKGRFDQLSVEYASDYSGEGSDRPKSVADAFGKGTASGLSLSKADVYIECIRTWCHQPKKSCPSVCQAPPQPTTEVEKIDFELRQGYVMYVLPVKWLREAVDQALNNALFKDMAEPAGSIWPQNEEEKEVAFHNVDDALTTILTNTYGEEVLYNASAAEYTATIFMYILAIHNHISQ